MLFTLHNENSVFDAVELDSYYFVEEQICFQCKMNIFVVGEVSVCCGLFVTTAGLSVLHGHTRLHQRKYNQHV